MKTSLPVPVTVKKIIDENYRSKTYIFDEPIDASPGQFVMVWLPGVAEKPFGVANTDPFTITIIAVGNCTQAIHDTVKVGDTLWYRGPFGNSFSMHKPGKKIIVAGGYGVVPLYALAKALNQPQQLEVILGARTEQDLLYMEQFKKLGVKVTITTDDGSVGIEGFTTQVLVERLKSEKITMVYSCGPEVMLEKIARMCEDNHVKYEVSMEAMMKCGFGVCGSCSKHGQLVCIDGPIFDKWPEAHD